ncbi:MBL fold metallo-hydrolase [Halioglobus maricola]|uniref:MBL fold metallo-hydrolase n=1 Tax=Halioglobus maricola TaxID=2601894 RepID=A0A5P9NIT6_9GAMM|nr:MBL fold metallo-hydrolase [Halioglobus maricola]QFU75652.1 MBL fold metallo-hydrolase [Halioglobus maricola]
MKKLITHTLVAIAFLLIGMTLADTKIAETALDAARSVRSATIEVVGNSAGIETRTMVLAENPEIIPRLMEGGSFGGEYSVEAAQNMFGRTQGAIDDVLDKTSVVEVGPRSYLIRMPIVNAAFFVTDEGVVLVDTGMGPAGPAILKAIRSVTELPIHTIIYTHGHVDHAYGTWAIMEAGETPEIIAHDALKPRFERYIRLRGSLAKYMSQPEEQLPSSADDLVWPTRYFSERLEIEVGGEQFVLQHHKGETDDQLYVWVPGRRALASADYYQGFLPNAGNGKRVQRHVEEWSFAMKEMAALEPAILLPAHGEEITDTATIQENFLVLAETFDHITQHTVDGLNAGKRKDEIYRSVRLPEHLATHPTLNVQYVTPNDISKMLIKQYSGWWDDIPSNWTPATMEDQGEMIIELAGGNVPAIVEYAQGLIGQDIRLASHLTDWLFYARPDDPSVQQLVYDVYKTRIMDPDTNTMEMLTYLDQMTAARERARSR